MSKEKQFDPVVKDLLVRFELDGESFWVGFKLLGVDWIGRCYVKKFKAEELVVDVMDWKTWPKLPPQEAIKFEAMLTKINEKRNERSN